MDRLSPTAKEWNAIEALAIECRQIASEMARGFAKSAFQGMQKADKTFVTEADVAIERALRDRILKVFPDHNVWGEEDGGIPLAGSKGVTWVIDPIDGTYSFMNRVPFYSSLLAVAFDGVPIIGWACLPELDWVLHARKGAGASFNGKLLLSPDHQGSQFSAAASDILAIADPYRFRSVGAGAIVDRLLAEPYHTRVYPDALGYMLLLTGAVTGFVDPRTQVWDVAPFHVILPECGFVIEKWEGGVSLSAGGVYSYPKGCRDERIAALLQQASLALDP